MIYGHHIFEEIKQDNIKYYKERLRGVVSSLKEQADQARKTLADKEKAMQEIIEAYESDDEEKLKLALNSHCVRH